MPRFSIGGSAAESGRFLGVTRGDDDTRLARILGQIASADDRAWLIDRLDPPWQRRLRRLEARDEAIRMLALEVPFGSGRQMAKAIAAAVGRYASSGWPSSAIASRRIRGVRGFGAFSPSTRASRRRGIPSCGPWLAQNQSAFATRRPVDHAEI
jgi:hypothetical protein